MINVLHVGDKLTIGGSTIHGVTKLFSLWLPLFDKSMIDVKLCVLRGRDIGGEYLESYGIEPIYLDRGKYSFATIGDLCKLIKKNNVDVLHLHGYGASMFGRIAGLKCKIPVIIHEHMVDMNIPIFQRLADLVLAPLTSMGIAISNPVSEFMVRKRYLPQSKMKTVFSGVPLQQLSEKEPVFNVPEALPNIADGANLVGIVGRLHEIKGHRYFIEAAAKLNQQGRNYHFLIIGDGDLKVELERLASKLGVSEKIEFLGHVDNVTPLYHAMDVLVIASEIEGGPIVLFEAMACECAVVSTDSIGLKSAVENQPYVVFVPPKDSDAIANALDKMLGNEENLRKNQMNAGKASEKFDVNDTIAKFQSIYEQLICKTK